MSWQAWTEHWQWLSLALAPVASWIGLRLRGVHPWETFVRLRNLVEEIERCRQDLAGCEKSRDRCEASRESEQQATGYAMGALREMVSAAAMVKEAAEGGRLTTSAPSPTLRSNTRRRSSRSRRKPTGPLGLP